MPPDANSTELEASPAQLADALRAQLQLAPGESLYGIVDGAQDLELAYEAKCLYGQEIRSLFEGDMAPVVAEVAPYLVPIDPASGYLENWARRWGKNVGILLTTFADPLKLFRHLREIFLVKDEEGQEYFFRYYDPRVLRTYLPTCTPEEVRAFLGPANALLSESAKPNTMLRCAVDRECVSQASIEIPVLHPISIT
ncbi:MAG: DUF4123 domain-containing protein [Planctomycetota bacterium]|nr:DUF4123 domain-containing protein [Planctomycetota bacterium]